MEEQKETSKLDFHRNKFTDSINMIALDDSTEIIENRIENKDDSLSNLSLLRSRFESKNDDFIEPENIKGHLFSNNELFSKKDRTKLCNFNISFTEFVLYSLKIAYWC